MTSVHRVLVVEDHEPFRQVIRELLGHRADVRIIAEAVDGLEAVHQAALLQPDVVMLDIGLPILSGLEVADQLRAVVPDAKLMFVTNEPSLEVVDVAFRGGAHGYIYKPRVRRDVLPMFDAITRGARFVSGGLERIAQGDSVAAHCHQLLFYSSDAVLTRAFTRFVSGVLHQGKAVILLLSEAHEQMVRQSLEASYADFDDALRQERYISERISDIVDKVMIDGWPDTGRFMDAVDNLVRTAARRAANRRGHVAAAGECSATLWAAGHLEACVQFEHLWDEIAARHQIDTLCAFPVGARGAPQRVVRSVCAEHTEVEIT